MISAMAPLVHTLALATVVHDKADPATKRAVTAIAAVIDTVHVPVPEQPPPDQPVNAQPGAAIAVSTTLVPLP